MIDLSYNLTQALLSFKKKEKDNLQLIKTLIKKKGLSHEDRLYLQGFKKKVIKIIEMSAISTGYYSLINVGQQKINLKALYTQVYSCLKFILEEKKIFPQGFIPVILLAVLQVVGEKEDEYIDFTIYTSAEGDTIVSIDGLYITT